MHSISTRLTSVQWGFAGIAMGLAIAILPLQLSLILLVTIVLGIATIVTPLSMLALMLILAPLRTLIATESAIQLPLDVGQITFVAFLGISIFYQIQRRNPLLPISVSPVQLPIIIFVGLTAISIAHAPSVSLWITEWLKWIIIIILISACLVLLKHNLWQWVVFALCVGGTANALVGIYIFFGGSGADHLLINGQFFRAFGTFGQPNPFGGFMGLLLPVSVMMAYGYLSKIVRNWLNQTQKKLHLRQDILFLLAYGLMFVAMLIGLVASWSRGAWLSFIVSFAVLAFALPRRLWHSFVLVGLGTTMIFGVWTTGLLPQSIVDRVVSSTSDFFAFDDMRGVDITDMNYAVVERLAHWQAALNMLEAEPWIGIGFGNYEVAYSQYRLINWDEPLGHAHNYYLNILAEAGIIGGLGYLGMWLLIFWLTWRTRVHPNPLARACVIGLLGSWAYLATHSLIDNLYVNNLFLHLGIMLGVLAVLHSEVWHSMRWRIYGTSIRNSSTE